jgi:inosose dehydratase
VSLIYPTKKISVGREDLAMSVRIGINPLTWSNDDLPALGGDTPLAQCLSEGAQAGYAGFELGNKFPRETEVLRPLLAEHDLDLISGWYSGRLLERSVEEEIEAMESHVTLLSQMGATVVVFAEVSGCVHGEIDTPLSCRPVLGAGEWVEFGRKLSEVADSMLSRGVRMAYHHHMGTVVESEREINRLMAVCDDSVGLLLDTGHLSFAGGNPVATLRRHADRVVHVHCKDVRRQQLDTALNNDTSFLQAVLAGVFTVPGDGSIDFSSVLRTLKETNYQGWLVVEAEQDPAKADPLTYARMGYDFLRAQCLNEQLQMKET